MVAITLREILCWQGESFRLRFSKSHIEHIKKTTKNRPVFIDSKNLIDLCSKTQKKKKVSFCHDITSYLIIGIIKNRSHN